MSDTHLFQIDLNLLVYLDLLLRERSVTRAAAAAGITQSAMSRALSRLREHLDDQLLVQSGRTMQPTERARALQAPLNDVLAKIRGDIFAAGVFEPSSAQREFSIAAPDFMDALLTGPLITALSERAPGLDIHIAGMGPAVRGDILDGRLDLLIGFPPGDRATLHARKILSDRFVCVVRKGHPALPKMELERFVEYPHVLVTPGGQPGGFVDRALAERGLGRRVAVRVHSFMLAPAYIQNTNYVLTVPEKAARRVAAHHEVEVLELPLSVPGLTLSMVWHARNHRDAAHVWLREQILEIARAF